MKENIILYLDDHRGIYIPRDFATDTFRHCLKGITDEDIEILKRGPETEGYWETWDDVLSNCTVINPTTKQEYYLWQDGSLWLIDKSLDENSDESKEFFGDYY